MSDNHKNGFFIRLLAISVLVILGVVSGVTALFFVGERWVAGPLQLIVVVVLTILPASMYYVFIASRRSSLFQEYVVNLSRLGLLRYNSSQNENGSDQQNQQYISQMRLQSYVLRFEGVYGPLDKSLTDQLYAVAESPYSESVANASAPAREKGVTGSYFSVPTAVPVVLATIIIGICWLILLPPWIQFSEKTPDLVLLISPVFGDASAGTYAPLFGFLGAYFFSIQMLYRRFVTNDLRARCYISVGLRIVMAVIGAWIIQMLFDQAIFKDKVEVNWVFLLSFVAGAFPPVLWRLVREAGSWIPWVRTAVPSMDSRLPVSELDGLTVWHQTRLEEEDIENAYNMANADIVDLLVQTKIPPERIIDWVDQAILYSTISDQDKQHYEIVKHKLSSWGIRSASMLEDSVRSGKIDADNQSNMKFMGEFEYAKAEAMARGLRGFTNYALVKYWKRQIPAEN